MNDVVHIIQEEPSLAIAIITHNDEEWEQLNSLLKQREKFVRGYTTACSSIDWPALIELLKENKFEPVNLVNRYLWGRDEG